MFVEKKQKKKKEKKKKLRKTEAEKKNLFPFVWNINEAESEQKSMREKVQIVLCSYKEEIRYFYNII